MSSRDATKRIPKAIGTEAQLFGTYTLTDLAVGLFPGVAVLLLMQVVVVLQQRRSLATGSSH